MKNKCKKIIFVILILLSFIAIPVRAKTDNGIYASEEKIEIKEEKDKSILAISNDVEISSMIDGTVLVIGNNVKIKSSQDYIFGIGNNLYIENAGTKESFIIGENVTIKNSELRDAYILGNTITIEESKLRNAYIEGKTVVIDSTIEGDVYVDTTKLIVTENAIITGTLKYPKGIEKNIAESSTISNIKEYNEETKSAFRTSTKEDIFSKVKASLTMIIIALILYFANKKIFSKVENTKKDAHTIITTMLKGLGALIIIPIVSIFLIISTIGLPIGVITLLVYLLLIYLSVIPTAYYLGKCIFKDRTDNNYYVIAISIFVIYVLRMIPTLGDIVTFASLIFGLGIYYELIKQKISENNKVKETTLIDMKAIDEDEIKTSTKKKKKNKNTK